MEKAAAQPSSEGRELQCVGRLEIVRPRPLGFFCGSIPVPTEKAFLHSFNSALVPSPQILGAPRFRELPPATDLNTLPVVPNFPEKVLPVGAVQSKAAGELPWPGEAIQANIDRKCDVLALSGLVEYGDEIDVIAPADILKQIFKIPYSKSRLSIAVRRVGQTLVLNSGPDVEEGEQIVRRHSSQAKCADHSLFLNFAMHSVRMEACDCPPNYKKSTEGQSNSFLSAGSTSQTVGQCHDAGGDRKASNSSYPQVKQESLQLETNSTKRNKDRHPIPKSSNSGEQPRKSVQESEKHKRVRNDGFLRVLFWQFHNFRMLLGSDMLIFSNEKYAAVSLHLWDITQKVSPSTWLEAWLDNVMANVPELAICYHQNGVVHRYDLLKTDEILREAISEDGFPAFNPHVVQQNGLSVLRFLQENCKQDPGAYWLYKSTGDEVIQLFDLSAIPKNCSSDGDDSTGSLHSLVHRSRSDSLLSLGTLLYRIGHQMSLSPAPNSQAKCASFFRKCLEVLDEPDHLVVRALAHEQFARLLLSHGEPVETNLESLPVAYEVAIPEESLDNLDGCCESLVDEQILSIVAETAVEGENVCEISSLELSAKTEFGPSNSGPRNLIMSAGTDSDDQNLIELGNSCDESLAISSALPSTTPLLQTVSDPIASKLAAVHHVSQAIKSLRWMRQLQNVESDLEDPDSSCHATMHAVDFSVCACGDAECIEVCDIREWLLTSKIDHKLWKLVRLLGESYLALGQAYKEGNQLHQALKVVELACSLYGSMPMHFEDARFMSSIVRYSCPDKIDDRGYKEMMDVGDATNGSIGKNDSYDVDQFVSADLFWAKAWTLVGDVHVEFHFAKGKVLAVQGETKTSSKNVRVSSEVVEEVQRLKKKMSDYTQNCTSCSLANCSCQSDRASSGNSASSSTTGRSGVSYNRKLGKRSFSRNPQHTVTANTEGGQAHHKSEAFEMNEHLHDQFGSVENKKGTKPMIVDDLSSNGDLELHNGADTAEFSTKQNPKLTKGGIFQYLQDPDDKDMEGNLSAALCCYNEARKSLVSNLGVSSELGSLVKKIGWVCNELGRNRLERRQLIQAENAFADAVCAFREVSDYPNIILIYCNLGHGRRALAEEMSSYIEKIRHHTSLHDTWKQGLETVKMEYTESIRYYSAAKSELNAAKEGDESVLSSLRIEVYTQNAHTYLRLGMFLAREGVNAEIYESKTLEDLSILQLSPSKRRARKEVRKLEISANDAIREALSMYESLGDLRKQEAAFAHFQLACYQRDCCLKFLESDSSNSSNIDPSVLQRVKQYSLLAERNWQKAIDFYGPTTHPTMYLSVLIEKSALSLALSGILHSHGILESALSCMLEGRHVQDTEASSSLGTDFSETHSKFWTQLQLLLKKMLRAVVSAGTAKSPRTLQPQAAATNETGDSGKLRELYKMSLKCNDLRQLHDMHVLWTS